EAFPQRLSRGVRRRSAEIAVVQGCKPRRRAWRHRVLPPAFLRADSYTRRLPAARRRARAGGARVGGPRGGIGPLWEEPGGPLKARAGRKGGAVLPPDRGFSPRRC